MGNKGVIRTAFWTDLRHVLVADFPEVEFPFHATPSLAEFVRHNADYIAELSAPYKADTHNSN